MTLGNVTRHVLVFNGYQEVGGSRIMLIARAIRVFRDVFDGNYVANVSQRIWFCVFVDRVSNFYEAICQIRLFNASARNMGKGTSNVARRVWCQPPLNVALR